jgi:glutathione-regulated potassium-efflux system ancillary protein KefF
MRYSRQRSEADNVIVRNLETLYGNDVNAIDVAAEQAAYDGVDRVVFIYPTHWFNLTPMLKGYLNEVWQYGWAFGAGGDALKAKISWWSRPLAPVRLPTPVKG